MISKESVSTDWNSIGKRLGTTTQVRSIHVSQQVLEAITDTRHVKCPEVEWENLMTVGA